MKNHIFASKKAKIHKKRHLRCPTAYILLITNYTDLPDPIWTVKICFNPFLSFNTKTPSLLKNHTDFFLYMSLNQPFSVKINGIFASLNSFIYVVSEIDDKNINLNQNLKEKLQYHHPPLKFLFCRTASKTMLWHYLKPKWCKFCIPVFIYHDWKV